MIARRLEHTLKPWLGKGKAVILIGPRQVGKTTLTRKLAQDLAQETLWLTGDDPAARSLLQDISLARLKQVLGQHQVVVVDEAQRLTNAGLTLKLITDHFPQVQLLVTGSSSLDIAAQTKESLVGRKVEYLLFPMSFAEMSAHNGYATERSLLEHRMIYGYYPEVVQHDVAQAQRILGDLTDGLMYKDLLALDQLKKPSLLVNLLRALALQVSREVSYRELGQLIGADPATVERYIDLLEQTFVVFRLHSLSRNLRNEIKKGRKIYFYDNGIRNAVLKNYAPLALRDDTGALWENFLIAERQKRNHYAEYLCNAYFWRTQAQQEIDYIEEHNGQFAAFEFKWSTRKRPRFPKTFLQAYPNSQTQVITPDTFEAFVGMG